VAVIRLPPLRQREGDVGLLADYLTARINQESKDEPGYRQKKLSPPAKNLMVRDTWPGNVREMENTLMRAAVWSADETLDSEDIREALLTAEAWAVPDLMARPLG
jgi:transcriptional regulator with GAF, ATPase, and Fis domain